MLPFLRPKNVAGLIIERRKADASKESENEDQENQDLRECSERLIQAIMSKDGQAVADAFQACFNACEMAPHEENSMEAQNMKAAQEE